MRTRKIRLIHRHVRGTSPLVFIAIQDEAFAQDKYKIGNSEVDNYCIRSKKLIAHLNVFYSHFATLSLFAFYRFLPDETCKRYATCDSKTG